MIFSLTLALVGLFLVFLEFFLPGGVLAIGAGILLLLSFVFFCIEYPNFFLDIGYFLVLIGATILTCKLTLTRIRKGKYFYLDEDQEGYQTYVVDPGLVGKKAVACTDLKPSGRIAIGIESWQAVSQSGYISKNTCVLIVGAEGAHFIVKEDSDASRS